jgi:hypothetical protein
MRIPLVAGAMLWGFATSPLTACSFGPSAYSGPEPLTPDEAGYGEAGGDGTSDDGEAGSDDASMNGDGTLGDVRSPADSGAEDAGG